MNQEERIIQALNIENNCVGIFTEGQVYFEGFSQILKESSFAWKHSPILQEDAKYTYLSLYLRSESLEGYSSDPIYMKSVAEAIESQKKAALTAKIDLASLCFYDLLPDHLLNRWLTLRESAMKGISKEIDRPSDYDILHKIHVLTSEIANQDIEVSGNDERVMYDMFSSATGRLATKKGSFPVLNLHKNERSNIKPKNDLYLELDLNGAEIRTLLAFSGVEQPKEDIHSWNTKQIEPWISREQAKEQFFAWLYNPKSEHEVYDRIYNKKAYLEHFVNDSIQTPFGRRLPVDERRALNYLLQSTTSDIVLSNAYDIMKLLRGKRSFIAFTMHDSVVLDFAREDSCLVEEIKNIFETNLFGRFLSNVSIGKNFGEMRKVTI
jgi:hypothetical protein